MPLICYQDRKFSPESVATIKMANKIIREYQAQGYTLTLRQLYYQFVARDIVKNSMKEYKRIGSVVNDARMAGLIDWNAIEDRTRNLERQGTWVSPKDIIETCARQFKYDYWDSQPVRVEVWVEKEALVGVIERAAYKWRCPYFACRGYTSQSEQWRAGVRFSDYIERGQPVKILHLGDHDPSGIDMTRDNRDRLNIFTDHADVELIRLALNSNQIQQYNPPPNPAKLTDSRAEDYIAKFGESSWELDALDPAVIDDLITSKIQEYIDVEAWDEAVAREETARARIAEVARTWRD